MNGNPYAEPAIVLGAAMLLACILGLLWASYAKRPAGGKHARPARPFADPADRTDPEGRQFVEELHGDLGKPPPDWLDHFEPVHLETLARVRDAQAKLPPPTPIAVITASDPYEPELDDTGQLPAAVCTWGMTAPELADELAARYLT